MASVATLFLTTRPSHILLSLNKVYAQTPTSRTVRKNLFVGKVFAASIKSLYIMDVNISHDLDFNRIPLKLLFSSCPVGLPVNTRTRARARARRVNIYMQDQ